MSFTWCPKLEDVCHRCRIHPAAHKVGEENTSVKTIIGHNYTSYVCCHCFCEIMGPVVTNNHMQHSGLV